MSWLELFYDLDFIALIAQLTYIVAEHHKTLFYLYVVGLIGYMIFIAWIGTTVSRNIKETETSKDKILIQVQMVLAFLMSLTLSGMSEGQLTPFFLGFALIHVVQIYITYASYTESHKSSPILA